MSVERFQDLVLRSRQHSFSLRAAVSLRFQLRMDYGGPVPLTYPQPTLGAISLQAKHEGSCCSGI